METSKNEHGKTIKPTTVKSYKTHRVYDQGQSYVRLLYHDSTYVQVDKESVLSFAGCVHFE